MKGRTNGKGGGGGSKDLVVQLNCYDIIRGDSNGIPVILLSLEVMMPAAMERKRENDKRRGEERGRGGWGMKGREGGGKEKKDRSRTQTVCAID